MIIFDLDGTLANCDHRRSFVDPTKSVNHILQGYDGKGNLMEQGVYCNVIDGKRFKPNWKAFYEACDKDEPIKQVIHILESIGEAKEYGADTPWVDYEGIQIWSGRCESVRKKTEKWLLKNVRHYKNLMNMPVLKMRPIGDNTPDDQLKEKWLDEAIAEGKTIDFVFDDRPKVVRMWRRRGIFVFNCHQDDYQF